MGRAVTLPFFNMVHNNISAILFVSEGSLISGSYVITEPVTLVEAKTFLRLTSSSSDTLIQSLITGARNTIEKYLNRSLIPRVVQIECTHDGRFPLELPYGPVVMTSTDVFSIESVFYRYGGRQVWTDVTTDLDKLFEFTNLNNCALLGNQGQYRIKYTCEALTGEIFKTAIKQQVTFLYENRGDEELYQQGSSRQPSANVCDIVRNTLMGQSRLTWFG